MKRRLLITYLLLVLSTVISLAAAPSTFKVTHISSDHVYINGGSSDSLAVGDVLMLITDNQTTVRIEIMYVARHSSSCRVISGDVSPVVNDIVSVVERTSGPDDSSAVTTDTIAKSVSQRKESSIPAAYVPTPSPARLSGSISLLFSNWMDNSDAGLDFNQTTARLNLRVDRLWGQKLSLAVRTRGRHDAREHSYASGAGRSEWENRLWELSITYKDSDEAYAFVAGRFLPLSFGSVGYLDGGLATVRLKDRVSISAFGGRQPHWGYYNINEPATRTGAYFSYKARSDSRMWINQSTGVVSEYANGATSRTFLASSGTIRTGSRWGLSHTAEVDINTGWRKVRDGHSLVVSNLYLRSYYRFSHKFRLAVSYDSRQNYRTHVNRLIADSLFDDRTRQGIRGTITLSPVKSTWLTGSLGYRHVADDNASTTTYSGSIRRSGLLNNHTSFGLYLSGFKSPTENGLNYSVRSQITSGRIGLITIGYGRYLYAVNNSADSRSSSYIELGLNRNISSRSHLNGTIQHNNGDDIDGWRIQLELGYRY